MHISSWVKINWNLLKLLPWNKNTDMSQGDNSVKNWQNLSISSAKPDLYNIDAHIKIGENPLLFTRYRP